MMSMTFYWYILNFILSLNYFPTSVKPNLNFAATDALDCGDIDTMITFLSSNFPS